MSERKTKREDVVEDLVRLYWVARESDDAVRDELMPVISSLEDIAGPTVPRASAARLLGISQTALDRWIRKGEISGVMTPSGRREVPLAELLDLLQEIRYSSDAPTLASVIQDRRRQADAIDSDLLPARYRRRRPRRHRQADLQALAYHRAVAGRLDPRLIADAKKRLQRWKQNGRIHPDWASEWERVLEMPPTRIARLISSESDRARELRQNSPFAGALTEQERRRLLEVVDHALA